MSLERVLEPEVMDALDEARDYDSMDHSEVNRIFVTDLLEFAKSQGPVELGDVLDLGTGTAQIPIELCQRDEECRVMGIDMAVHMLDLARYNIEAAGLIEQITLSQVDAKDMGFDDGLFDVVMSNSIVHHIPDPMACLKEAVRVVCSEGLIFIRDLTRPDDEETLEQQVQTYAGTENQHSQQMFRESLHAALTLEEIRAIVSQLGFDPQTVQMTSDRHWTWACKKP